MFPSSAGRSLRGSKRAIAAQTSTEMPEMRLDLHGTTAGSAARKAENERRGAGPAGPLRIRAGSAAREAEARKRDGLDAWSAEPDSAASPDAGGAAAKTVSLRVRGSAMPESKTRASLSPIAAAQPESTDGAHSKAPQHGSDALPQHNPMARKGDVSSAQLNRGDGSAAGASVPATNRASSFLRRIFSGTRTDS